MSEIIIAIVVVATLGIVYEMRQLRKELVEIGTLLGDILESSK